jgi:hypothetical protein
MRSVAILLFLAACGGGPASPSASVVPSPPSFLQAARAAVPTPFDGRVTQVVPAGGYTYLQVDAGEDSRWVVIIHREVAVGDSLTVRPFGQLDGFTSKKTGLTFDHLVFATITSWSV